MLAVGHGDPHVFLTANDFTEQNIQKKISVSQVIHTKQEVFKVGLII